MSRFATSASEMLRAVLLAFPSSATENTPRCCSVYRIPPKVSSPVAACPGAAGVKSQLISAIGSSGLVVTVRQASFPDPHTLCECETVNVTVEATLPVYCKFSKAWQGTGNGPLAPQLAAGGSQYSCE